MDRLMCLHVQTSGEPVEVLVNGVPVLALPAGAGSQSITVHEYLPDASITFIRKRAMRPLPSG